MNSSHLVVFAALLGASGVGLGAYHAHGLEKWMERQATSARAQAAPELWTEAARARRIANCETAVRYQLIHAVALLSIAALQAFQPRRVFTWSAGLMLAGLAGFSGGLYEIVFRGRATHWSIVPLGGVLLIVAWLVLAAALGSPRESHQDKT